MAAESESASVVARAEGPVWIVTLSRPEARNAVNMAVARGLQQAMAELDERPDLRVGILTADALEGARAFTERRAPVWQAADAAREEGWRTRRPR